MYQIRPPTAATMQSFDRGMWHSIFNPSWESLISMGYVDGAVHHNWTNVIAIDDEEDQVAFHGESPNLGGINEPLTVAVEMFAVSTDALDTTQVVICNGIGPDFLAKSISTGLTGTTPVSLGEWIHINECFILTLPTDPIGVILVSDNAVGIPLLATDNVQIYVRQGYNRANNPMIMCPDDQHYVLTDLGFSVSSDKNMEGVLVKFHSWVWLDGFYLRNIHSGTFTIRRDAPVPLTGFVAPPSLNNRDCIYLSVESTKAKTFDVHGFLRYNELGKDVQDPKDNRMGIDTLFELEE